LFCFQLVLTAGTPPPPQDKTFLDTLRSLGVQVDLSAPVDPNGVALQTDPLGTSGSNSTVALYPLKEIFIEGIKIKTNWNGIYNDFKGRDPSTDAMNWLWNDYTSTTDRTAKPKKAVAGDFDGDGLDEILLVVANINMNNKETDDNIQLYKVDYDAGGDQKFSLVRRFPYPGSLSAVFTPGAYQEGWQGDWDKAFARIDLASGKIFGGDKDGVVLAIGDYVFLLDNNFNETSRIYISPETDGVHYLQVATADYDQDGVDEWMLVKGTSKVGIGATCSIYKGASHTAYNDKEIGRVINERLRTANVVTGDFNGDGLPDTAFYGKIYSDSSTQYLHILLTEMDKKSSPEFKWLSAEKVDVHGGTGTKEVPIPALAAGDMDGDRKAEIVANNTIWTLNGETLVHPSWKSEYGSNNSAAQPYEDLLFMGDVNGDRRADIIAVSNRVRLYSYFDNGVSPSWISKEIGDLDNNGGITNIPAICLPNVDNDSYVLKYIGHDLRFTKPQVLAVLAAPPFWASSENRSGGTSYGQSSGIGEATEHSGSEGFGFTLGVKTGFSVLGFTALEQSVKATLQNNLTWGLSSSTSISTTWSFNTEAEEDDVIFTSIPFDEYYYEVITAPNEPDAIPPGRELVISIPRKVKIYHNEREYYNAHNGDAPDVVLQHTIGNPYSYMTKPQMETIKDSYIPKFYDPATGQEWSRSDDGISLWKSGFIEGSDANGSKSLTASVGNGGSTTLAVEVNEESSNALGYGNSFTLESESTFASVIVGGSFEHTYDCSFTTSSSNGTTITGEVPRISINYANQHPDAIFDWGFFMYNTGEYDLVTYWVDQK
jgi:hypothetical protein